MTLPNSSAPTQPARKLKLSGKQWLAVAGVAFLVVSLLAWLALKPGAPTEAAAVPADPIPVSIEELEVPDVYLFQHFLEELHRCYLEVGHEVSMQQLEREVGRDWDVAVMALMQYFHEGKCAEWDDYLRIPGRAAWMVAQVAPEPDPAEPGQ